MQFEKFGMTGKKIVVSFEVEEMLPTVKENKNHNYLLVHYKNLIMRFRLKKIN